MKRYQTFLTCVLCLAFVNMHAKELKYIGVSVTNNVTALPFSGFPKLFHSQFHPGITLSTGFNWTEKPKHNLMQSFKLGYLHHRFIQKSIMLYSEFGYRHKTTEKLGLSVAVGGGYLHMIPGDEQLRMNADGDWEMIKLKSRPQALISISMGVDYQITENGIRAFVRYQNMLQTPFVPGYVPLLPYNVFHLGATIPMKLIKKGGNNAQ